MTSLFCPSLRGKRPSVSVLTDVSARFFYNCLLPDWGNSLLFLICRVICHEKVKNCQIFVYIDRNDHVLFSLFLLMLYITWIGFQMLSQPWISKINPAWSWCNYPFYAFYWIWFANILLSFASVYEGYVYFIFSLKC